MSEITSSRRDFLKMAALAAGTLCAPNLASAQASQPIRLRVSSSLSTDDYSEHYFWFRRFADNLKTAVGDQIQLDYFPNGQLGKENDVVQLVKVGSVDIMVSGSSYWASAVPEVGMLDMGYLFDSYDHVQKQLTGNVGQTLSKLVFDRTKVTILGWSSLFGARNIYAKKPIASLADIQGLKMRVLPVPIFLQSIEAIGAIPTPISMNELYTSLQTGIVDALEQNAGTVLGMKFFEVTKNCYLSEHMFTPMSIAASARAMSKVPPSLMPAFRKAADEACAYQFAQTPDKVRQATDELVKRGVTFTAMSAGDRTTARQAVLHKVWQPFIEKYPLTKPLVSEIDSSRA